LADFQSRTNL